MAHPSNPRKFVSRTAWLSCALLLLASTAAAEFDWEPYREDSTIEIITVDEDGTTRETKIWIVVLGERGFIRTNESRWLANIKRDPTVLLRTRGVESEFMAQIVSNDRVYDAVEEAFRQKYGFVQRLMSAFRMSRPTVMRLSPGPFSIRR